MIIHEDQHRRTRRVFQQNYELEDLCEEGSDSSQGIILYMKSGCNRLVCRNGNYMAEAPDGRPGFEDEGYLSLFGEDDIFVESNMIKLRSQNPAAYAATQEQEIGAALQCLSRKEGIPYTMVNFEVFNRNRKWSDKDVTLNSSVITAHFSPGGFAVCRICHDR